MLFATQFSDRLRKAKSEEALPGLARELAEIIQKEAPTFKPLLLIELGRSGSSDKVVEELDLSPPDMAKRSERKAELFSIIDSYVDELFVKKAMCDAALVECKNLLFEFQKLSATTSSGIIAKSNCLSLARKEVDWLEGLNQMRLQDIDNARRDLFKYSGYIISRKSSKARRIIVGTQVVFKETQVDWNSYSSTRRYGSLRIWKQKPQPPVHQKVRNVKTIRVTFSLKEGVAELSEVAFLDEELPEKVESTPARKIQYIPLKPDEKVAGLEVLSKGVRYVDLVDDPKDLFYNGYNI